MAEEKKVSEKVEKLVDEISKLSAIELSDLVSSLKEKLGIQETMPIAQVSAPQVAEQVESQEAPASEGGASQTVIMTNAGDKKIEVIKALREINPNLGLKEAKDATENLPYEVIKDVKPEVAKEAAEKLKAAGATVEIK